MFFRSFHCSNSFTLLSRRILHSHLSTAKPVSMWSAMSFFIFTRMPISFSFLSYSYRTSINEIWLILGLLFPNEWLLFIYCNTIPNESSVAISTNGERKYPREMTLFEADRTEGFFFRNKCWCLVFLTILWNWKLYDLFSCTYLQYSTMQHHILGFL